MINLATDVEHTFWEIRVKISPFDSIETVEKEIVDFFRVDVRDRYVDNRDDQLYFIFIVDPDL